MNWRLDDRIAPLEGARGEAVCRGEVGVADFPAGTYPACSLHGALAAVGQGKWRCLVEGCNAGAETAWPWSAVPRSVVLQREAAMAKGNRIRCTNALLFRGIAELPYAEARQLVASMLRSPVDTEWSMRVGQLLLSVSYVGAAKAGLLLRTAGVGSGDRHLAELTERQRLALAAGIESGELRVKADLASTG